eukprot:EG_transcript_10950
MSPALSQPSAAATEMGLLEKKQTRHARIQRRLPASEVQERLKHFDIDVQKVVNRYPALEWYTAERVGTVTSYLEGLGVNVKRVVESQPGLLACPVPALEAVVCLLRNHDINVAKAIQYSPPILKHSLCHLQDVIGFIFAQHPNPLQFINDHPDVLGIRKKKLISIFATSQQDSPSEALRTTMELYPSCLDSHVIFMHSLCLDHRKVFKIAPQLFRMRIEKLQSVANFLKGLGLDVAHILQTDPLIMCYQVEKLQERIKNFESCVSLLGPTVPAHQAIKWAFGKAPSLFRAKVQTVHDASEYLRQLNVDINKVLRHNPQLLGFHVATLSKKEHVLRDHNLDAARMVRACPAVFGFSIERKIKPMLSFLLNEMERSADEVNGAPAVLGLNLEKRLRPRFMYLRSLGRDTYSISYAALTKDAVFSRDLAGRDLAHYYQWRTQNGFLP